MDTQDTLSVEASEAGDGGDEAIAEPGESSSTSRRARTFLAVLFWFEGAWATSFFGRTIAYWAGLPGAFASLSMFQRTTERHPRFKVRWDDGHETVLVPGPDVSVESGRRASPPEFRDNCHVTVSAADNWLRVATTVDKSPA